MTIAPFICLYREYMPTFAMLSMEDRGRLVTAMMEYAEDRENMSELTGNGIYSWPMIRTRIDRDVANYEERCERNRKNGAKGGRPRKVPAPEDDETDGFFGKPNDIGWVTEKPNYNDNYNDNQNYNNNDIYNDSNNESRKDRNNGCISGDNWSLSPLPLSVTQRMDVLVDKMFRGTITQEEVEEYKSYWR